MSIRRVQQSDADEFLALMHLSKDLHYPWIFPPLSQAGFQQYLKRTERDDHEGFLICDPQNGAIAGVINLNNIVYGAFLSASLGYYAGAPYSGRGYMTAGLEHVKDIAFKSLGLHRIEANIQPANKPSTALVQRCGFRKEGYSPAYLYIDGAWRGHDRWTFIDERTTMTRRKRFFDR